MSSIYKLPVNEMKSLLRDDLDFQDRENLLKTLDEIEHGSEFEDILEDFYTYGGNEEISYLEEEGLL